MEDLSEKLDQLLSSPDGMKRIGEMMAMLGGSESSAAVSPPPPEKETPDLGMLSGLAALLPESSKEPSGDLPDLRMLTKLAPLLGQMGKEDENTALLRALRPHLKNGREKRLDESVQMLRMMKLLPLLQGLQQKGGDST